MAEDGKAPLWVLVVLMILVAEQLLAQLLERPVVSFHHDYVSLLCDSVINQLAHVVLLEMLHDSDFVVNIVEPAPLIRVQRQFLQFDGDWNRIFFRCG